MKITIQEYREIEKRQDEKEFLADLLKNMMKKDNYVGVALATFERRKFYNIHHNAGYFSNIHEDMIIAANENMREQIRSRINELDGELSKYLIAGKK